ncbi:MAG: hypothetical protein WBB68_04420, partial [Candidatus Moraniibacteriota bacterium]
CKSGLPSHPTQEVLESQGAILADEFVTIVRARVEAVSKMIVRRVRVDRGRTPEQVIDATGRTQYVNKDVVATMPRGEGEEVDVYFFKPDQSAYDRNGIISDDKLHKEFERYGFKPDPYAQAAVNDADTAFVDEYPNGTHWQDTNGKWCYAAFSQWGGGRDVVVYRDGSDWRDSWWFAGVPK